MTRQIDVNGQAVPRGDYDVVVIGSGIGGLMAAALLARLEGRRVLVLERHYRASGFTHTFERPGGFSWDVGVHYVGSEVLTPGVPRDAFQVASGGALAWTRLPDPFERLVFPGFEFEIRAGRQAFVDDLTRAFPAEAASIRAWLADVDRACGLLPLQVARAAVPRPVRWAMDAASAGRARFADRRLRAIAGARWGDHGLPPGESAFLAHAVITRHYLEGAVFPVGSAGRIAETMGMVIAAAGGTVTIGHFTGHPGGEVYGLPWTPGALRQPWRSARTPLRGLHLAGADAVFLGVVGAAMGGVAAAARAAGPGILRKLSPAGRELGAPAVGAPRAPPGQAA